MPFKWEAYAGYYALFLLAVICGDSVAGAGGKDGENADRSQTHLDEISFGNYVELTSGRFGNMSFAEKVNFVSSMVDRGMLKVDEVRDIFGFEPMPDGQGQVTPIRGEYHYLENSEVDTNAEESE